MLLPQHGRFARRLSVADLYREEFTMKLINAAQVIETVNAHGCGDWGTVEVSVSQSGLLVILNREIHMLPIQNGMAVVQDDPAQATLMAWVDDMGF